MKTTDSHPSPQNEDDLATEYIFDYPKAKPNRFARQYSQGKMTVTTTPSTQIAASSPEDKEVQQLLLDVTNTRLTITSEQFDRLCIDNPDLRLELTPESELIVMAPTGGESGEKNADLVIDVGIWNRQAKLGRVFDSSTGYDFTAINGGKPSPDVSWIEKSRLDEVNIIGFISVVPDFVIELRSATDSLSEIKTKMEKYQRVGVRMGLLIDPKKKQVEIYRQGQETEILESPISIDCSEVMPGFILDMTRIW